MSHLQQNDPSSTRHLLRGGRVTIGRNADNDIVLPSDMRVSRHHSAFELREGEWFVTDLRSRNGTHVNGKRVSECSLKSGDRIKIGGSTFSFTAGEDPFATIGDASAEPGQSIKVPLSDREREILALLCRGSTDQQIGNELLISLATVRSHLDRIRDKTGCRRRPDLTRLAIDLGLDR